MFGATPGRPFEQVRIADTKRAEELLGWTSKVSLNGLKRTIAWYERNRESPWALLEAANGQSEIPVIH